MARTPLLPSNLSPDQVVALQDALLANADRLLRASVSCSTPETWLSPVQWQSFEGEHVVECYVLKHGIVVARDRIDVPISSTVRPAVAG